MIMSNKVNFIFRGSPILPAGSSLCKSLFSAWTWHSVHFKLLAKLSKYKLSQNCIKTSLFKLSKSNNLSKNVMSSSSVLSLGRANTATLAVTRKSLDSKPGSDPSPSLQTWVGDGLQGLYVTMLGGMPPAPHAWRQPPLRYRLQCPDAPPSQPGSPLCHQIPLPRYGPIARIRHSWVCLPALLCQADSWQPWLVHQLFPQSQH